MITLPKIIVIVGPTASGKTDAGIAVARAVDGEVISADSRTIYRGMNIGTAKPEGTREWDKGGLGQEKPSMIESIPHWGIDIADPDQVYTVSEFQAYADKKIKEIIGRGHVPILVGGTGLYIRAVIDRPTFAEVPPDPAFRAEVATLSNAQLFDEIADRDPDGAASLDENNRRRLERALEILRATGKTLADSRSFEPKKYEAKMIGMEVPRDELFARIDLRVDSMIAKGLVDEVRLLKEKYGSEANAMTGIGYRQITEFLDGKSRLKDAIARIKFDSHHYAKRQETWFKRDARITWVKDARGAVNHVMTDTGIRS
ncbi:MAG: tRNA (adenosine(37)-N6)-dimethylallyltransferase MiaA [Patescibacteria group bacterium]|jgi:tRNA dimethylallyltransferase